MQLAQSRWTETDGWGENPPDALEGADLVLVFGGAAALRDDRHLEELRSAYPQAHLLGCSTAGEIYDVHVIEDSLVATAIEFEGTQVIAKSLALDGASSSFDAGIKLARQLPTEGLRHVFVLSEGLDVNGSELVRGLTRELPADVGLTGGLSGDGDRFGETWVLSGGPPQRGMVAALGLYGDDLSVGYGSLGGWDPFGPERVITRAEGNVLYELDGKSALQLYKEYLGEQADGLPATGLLFPLTVRSDPDEKPVVRTILSVSEEDQSMTFAGDITAGSLARLMKANFNRLVDGAADAAKSSYEALDTLSPDLAILISCVGRRFVLKQRVEEEIDAVREIMGETTVLTGFYSYGEISPFSLGAKCELHNQTMAVTAFVER